MISFVPYRCSYGRTPRAFPTSAYADANLMRGCATAPAIMREHLRSRDHDLAGSGSPIGRIALQDQKRSSGFGGGGFALVDPLGAGAVGVVGTAVVDVCEADAEPGATTPFADPIGSGLRMKGSAAGS